MEPEKLLENLYKTMPSVPGLVFFTRKMNKSTGKEDTPAETRSTMNTLIKLLSDIDFDVAEKKHLSFVQDLSDSESEYTVSSEEKKENPFISSKVKEVTSQLEKLNELDKKLTQAIYSIEDKIKEVKNQLDLGNNLADEFSMGQAQGSNTDFSALFDDPPTETSRAFLPDIPCDLPPIPRVLARQTAEPPSIPLTVNIN